MAINQTQTAFFPSGDKARGASAVQARALGNGAGAVGCHATQSANVGDYQRNNVMNAVIVNPLAEATVNLVKASGKVEGASTSYITLAAMDLLTAPDKAARSAELIADICQTAKVVSSKGKANPQALKTSGHSSLAEVARLLKKVAANYDGNVNVQLAVDGFIGIVADEAHFAAELAAYPAMIKAVAAEADEAAIAKVTATFRVGYLDRMYQDRPTSFSALRRAIDKATKPVGQDASEEAPAEVPAEGSGEGADVTAAAVVIGADDMAASLIGRIGDVSDDNLVALFDAIKGEMNARVQSDNVAAAA